MSVQLIETTEEDSLLAVARHVGELLNEGEERTALADTTGSRFITECEGFLSEHRFADLLDAFVSKLDVLFTKTKGQDLECCLNIICHLVPRVSDSQLTKAADSFASALSSKASTTAPEARLQGLVTLFNVLEDPKARYSVLLKVLEHARTTGTADSLIPAVKGQLDVWAAELDTAQQQQLYIAVANLMRSSKKKKSGMKEAFNVMMKCFDTLQLSSPKDVSSLKEPAVQTVYDFIRSPDLFQFDLWESAAVQQLADDKDHADTFKLLSILLTQDVKAFMEFAKSRTALFDTIGCSYEDTLAKARLLNLLALASVSQGVLFSDIKDALVVEEGEVEQWVVKAIGKKLLEGRIDQLRCVLAITQCSSRTFGSAQWEQLKTSLQQWRENLEGVEDMVANHQTALPKGLVPVIRA